MYKVEFPSFLRKVATVLTVYGIETPLGCCILLPQTAWVATVLTVYGIETEWEVDIEFRISMMLQQYLPFTVLERFYYRDC